jgi:hypothetical protein
MENACPPPQQLPFPRQQSSPFQQPSPFCHPERSRGICGAPFGCPTFTVLEPLSLCHPERSASQIYRKRRALWRGVEEPAPSIAEGPGDACWQMLLGAFRPQTTTEFKKVTNSDVATCPGLPWKRSGGTYCFLPLRFFHQ